jgi:transposase
MRYCLSEGDASRLALDAQFINARFWADQIVRPIEFASTELHITSSARAVARAFEVDHSAVKRAQLRGYDDLPARGRHSELAADAEQQLVHWITAKAANNFAINQTELLHECNERFGNSITRGSADSFLTRQAEQLFKTKSVPQENPKLEVLRVFLQVGLDGFQNHVH